MLTKTTPAPVRRVSLGALLKWREDQERDERGRWTSGGGGGGSAASERSIPASRFPRSAPGVLDERGVAVETRFAEKLAADPEAAMAEYSKLTNRKGENETAGGKILNTDLVRELSPDYRNDRAHLSPAVHEPASEFTKMMYAKKLAEPPVSNTVMFTAGGAGAGKSSGIKDVPTLQGMQDMADVIYDTNMNKFNSAKEKIDQALASGRDVQIAYVARDPVEALVQGALPRAMGSAGGRTVPLSEHVKTHVGAARTMEQIADHYRNDPRVQIHYIDNRNGRGGARLADESLTRQLDFTNLEARLQTALKEEYDAGRISTAVYEGTRGSNSRPHG